MKHLKYRPNRFWDLDDTAPFQDYSGYGADATLANNSQESHGLPLVSYVDYSQIFNNNNATFPSPVYLKGQESQDFTLMCTVFPIISSTTAPGKQQVFSGGGEYDGIYFDGRKVCFATFYSDSSAAICSYDPQEYKKMFIVATHTLNKNSLYINGELVSEVDITSTQQALQYKNNNNNLYSGYSDTSRSLLANSFGIYSTCLSSEAIQDIYQTNTRTTEGSVSKIYSGQTLSLGYQTRKPLRIQTWTSESDWRQGLVSSVTIEDSQLVAQRLNGATINGNWTSAVDLYTGNNPATLSSAHLFWDGIGETIQASTDGMTWSNVNKGQNISVIPQGFNPTGKALYLRVSFAAGLTEGYVENLSLKIYSDNTAINQNRTITYGNPIVVDEPQIISNMNQFAEISAQGGGIQISPDTTGTLPNPKTVEFIIKSSDWSNFTIALDAVDNVYVNGVAFTGTFPTTNQWVVVHYVRNAGFTSNIVLSGQVDIAKASFYSKLFTSTDCLNVIKATFAYPTASSGLTGSIGLTESTEASSAYTYDWQIVDS